MYHLLNDEFVNLHKGQGMDIYWREHMICPAETEYLTMVNNSEFNISINNSETICSEY